MHTRKDAGGEEESLPGRDVRSAAAGEYDITFALFNFSCLATRPFAPSTHFGVGIGSLASAPSDEEGKARVPPECCPLRLT